MIDDGAELDLDAVRQNIAEAEVITFYFPLLGRTLLVDTRCDGNTGTLVRVVPMARDTGERLRSLRRLRPTLPRPDSITMIPWHMRVGSVVSSGVWDCVLGRVDDHPAAEACLDHLRTLERSERLDAILGRRYESLWTREGAREVAEEDDR